MPGTKTTGQQHQKFLVNSISSRIDLVISGNWPQSSGQGKGKTSLATGETPLQKCLQPCERQRREGRSWVPGKQFRHPFSHDIHVQRPVGVELELSGQTSTVQVDWHVVKVSWPR